LILSPQVSITWFYPPCLFSLYLLVLIVILTEKSWCDISFTSVWFCLWQKKNSSQIIYFPLGWSGMICLLSASITWLQDKFDQVQRLHNHFLAWQRTWLNRKKGDKIDLILSLNGKIWSNIHYLVNLKVESMDRCQLNRHNEYKML